MSFPWQRESIMGPRFREDDSSHRPRGVNRGLPSSALIGGEDDTWGVIPLAKGIHCGFPFSRERQRVVWVPAPRFRGDKLRGNDSIGGQSLGKGRAKFMNTQKPQGIRIGIIGMG